jgi:hypothetical protein
MLAKIYVSLLVIFIISQAYLINCATIDIEKAKESKRFLFGSDEVVEKPELDWDTIQSVTVNVNVKEIEMIPKDFYKKVEECIEKCMKSINSDRSARDQCVAKTCDIY